MKPVKYQLKNGLTVILAESRKSPALSVQAWVRTGSADESPAQAGISHFIEHLVFKGTNKFGVGEIAATVEGAGGELNAYTSFDQTVFHVTIASAEAETALEVISEMMGYPLFDPDEVDREREVVIEEIKRGHDSPGRRNSQLLFSSAFKKHPYGRPVIGYERVIKKVSVPILRKYYRDRYCPRNMFVLITGDFERADMRQRVERHFGRFVDSPVRKVVRPKETNKRSGIKIEKAPFKETHINMSWRIPSVKHKDVPALDALALILGQGDSSRLTHRLRIENALVHSVGSSAFTPLDEGLFTVTMALDAENSAAAIGAVGEELKMFLTEGPTAAELAKAIVGLASDTIYSLETVDGLSRSFGSMEFYLNDPAAYPKYLKALEALNPVDVLKVARKYLKPSTLTMTVLTDSDPGAMRRRLKQFQADYPTTTKKIPASAARIKRTKIKSKVLGPSKDNPIERVTLPGGGLLLLKRQSETPTVSFRLAFGGGVALEPDGREGLNELFSRTLSAGGRRFSEAAINLEVDATASGFGAFSGRNTSGLNADFVSAFDDRIWALIEDSLAHPEFPSAVFERERGVLLRQTHLRKDHPSHLCMRAFLEKLFAGHPYAKDPHGSEKTLSSLKIDEIRSLASQVMVKGNVSAAVVGDFDPEVWKDRLSKLVDSYNTGGSRLREISHLGPVENVRLFNKLAKEQTHLIIGMKGLGVTDPRRWALQVMQAVLAGQGGRLFIELRDKKSLAYSVSPIQMEGLGTGSFGAYIACSPEKTETAERMIRAEFAKLADNLIPEDELRRARRYLSGRTIIDLQRKSTIASSILFDEIYGNPAEEGLHPDAKYAAVTAEDIRALAVDLFSQPTVVSIVGPMEPVS